MARDHRDGWTPRWVISNTIATGLGAVAGVAALIIAVMALIRTGI